MPNLNDLLYINGGHATFSVLAKKTALNAHAVIVYSYRSEKDATQLKRNFCKFREHMLTVVK